MPLGWPELLVVLVIVLLVFGPKRLPMLGRQLGGGMREFKDSITNKSKDADADADADEAEPAARPEERLTAAQPVGMPGPPPATTQVPTGARDESAKRAENDPTA